jgi:hypothetical protein
VRVTIIVDFIHVLEYLWTATWCLHSMGALAAETWVRHQARQVLSRRVDQVITELATQATGLAEEKRTGIDRAVKYLTNQQPYLDYPTALASGWPIATGIIEGACRHLVKDRAQRRAGSARRARQPTGPRRGPCTPSQVAWPLAAVTRTGMSGFRWLATWRAGAAQPLDEVVEDPVLGLQVGLKLQALVQDGFGVAVGLL